MSFRYRLLSVDCYYGPVFLKNKNKNTDIVIIENIIVAITANNRMDMK